MPTSNMATCHDMIRIIDYIQPKTVLDVGCGYGRWGYLVREIMDIVHTRYAKETWQTIIDAVEIYAPYITPAHNYIYTKIYTEDIRTFNPNMVYDLIILGDIIEHLDKPEAQTVIDKLRPLCKNLIITTPNGYIPQGEVLNNPHEIHKCGFSQDEFIKQDALVIDCGITFIAWFKRDKYERKDINSNSNKQKA